MFLVFVVLLRGGIHVWLEQTVAAIYWLAQFGQVRHGFLFRFRLSIAEGQSSRWRFQSVKSAGWLGGWQAVFFCWAGSLVGWIIGWLVV